MDNSLVDMILRVAEATPTKKALFHKINGDYVGITYKDMVDHAFAFSSFLETLKLAPGSRISIMSNNRPEWVFCDFGTMALGSALVPIYGTLADKDILYIMNKCQIKIAVFENADQINRLLPILGQIPTLQALVCFDNFEAFNKQGCPTPIYSFSLSIAPLLGKKPNRTPLNHDTIASIVFTSGTTGTPKGAMLSHGNFLANIEGIYKALPILESDSVLSFLPLSHVFERTTGYYVILGKGATIYYAENMDTVSKNIMEARPTAIISVPRLYEKIRSKILTNLTGFKKPLFHWAMAQGRAYVDAKKANKASFFLKYKNDIADHLVFSKIREKTGGALRFFVSGGAPLSKDLGEFFETAGLAIIEGYGMTETSPVISCNRLEDFRFGTVGKALDNVETKLEKDGELCVKGPSIMSGYLDDPTQTAEIIDSEGWLHTGDIAQIDTDGFIKIIGRKKDLIVLSNGKKVAPQPIELALTQSPYIAQAILIGDNRNYIVALLVPNWEAVQKQGPLPHFSQDTPDQLVKDDAFIHFIDEEVKRVNATISKFEQIKKFALLALEFSQEKGELTPSLKPKRGVIKSRYENTIEHLYDLPAE